MSSKTSKRDPVEGPAHERIGRWPLYAGLLAACVAGAILIYSIHSDDQKRRTGTNQATEVTGDTRPLIADSGKMSGFTGQPKLPPGADPKPQPTPQPQPQPQLNIKVEQDGVSQELRREREELRRYRHQAAMTALTSGLVARKGKTEDQAPGKGGSQASQAVSRESQSQRPREIMDVLSRQRRDGDYDPAADKDKEEFFNRAKASDKWVSPNTRVAGHPYEVKTGSVIPAVMIAGINSDLPGQIIAQVAQNVYDSAEGRSLLIPQGSKLYGIYDSRVIYGQSRVLVAWQRIIFPDGSSITLESMPGTDSAGYSGFTDEVNNHYFRIFGQAILMSLITGGTSWSIDTVTPTSSSNTPTFQQQMSSALATQLGQATSQMLSKNMNIKPTLEIRPGYRFNVVVTKDLVFKEAYSDAR